MKKSFIFALIIFASLIMVSCKPSQDDYNKKDSDLNYLLLGKSEEKHSFKNTDEYKNYVNLVGNFSTDLSEKLYVKYNNKYDKLAVSPISIYMALAMATSVAESSAQEELANMLRIPYEDIIEYTKFLYNRLNRERCDEFGNLSHSSQLSNSIWLNDKYEYNNEGLEILKDALYADSYAAPFTTNNDAANKAVQDYVYRNTKGLINNEYKFSVDTLFLLINTLYLKDVWDNLGKDLIYTSDMYKFKNINNTTTDTKLLTGYYLDGHIQQGNGFEYFYTKTANGLRVYFIKPTTKNLNEIYNHNNLNMVLNDVDFDFRNEELKEEYYTRCLFPEFEASFNEDVTEVLKEEYGISKIFRKNVSNFDKLTNEICFTDSIVHQSKLIVNKKGIEGAAVTLILNAGAAAPDETYTKVFSDFVIDSSFGFMITYDSSILFSGVVNNL